MKKNLFIGGLAIAGFLVVGTANAQMVSGYGTNGGGMMGSWTYPAASSTLSASDTQMITEGKALYAQLQAKQISCSQLTSDNYEQLGEYFMDQATGASHAAMDSMMSGVMGEQGDQAIHIAWGEQYSGCVANATLSNGSWNSMMQGGGSTPWNKNYGFMPMMGYYGEYNYGPMMGYGYGWFGWIFDVLFWILIVFGIVMLVRRLNHSHHGWRDERSATDILKERYARGEIDKKEYEEKRKDLES